MNWTNEQTQAIYKRDNNIIVSAGAGSGKTAVLTERICSLLLEGVDITSLLVVTFTKKASAEMKDRIRKKIVSNPSLQEQVTKIDSAYITTFDSFTYNLVSTYHYLLGLDKNICIAPSGLIQLQASQIIEEIFDEYYRSPTEEFLEFIKKYVLKDDDELKSLILKINDQLDTLVNKKEYLNSYLELNYSDSFILELLEEYLRLIKIKVKELISLTDVLQEMNSTYYENISDNINSLLTAKTYNEFKKIIPNIILPRLSKNSEDLKEVKAEVSSLLKTLNSLLIYEDEISIKNHLLATKNDAKFIIEIICQLDERLDSYKKDVNYYTFNDITLLAIKLLNDNIELRESLKMKFHEILIDEYQDTNDTQEALIKLLSRNNVYMVGDVKQSIYRFRFANPDIFRDKYESYKDNTTGYKIDLNQNFRSRSEVVNTINLLFNNLMTLERGGAAYLEDHNLIAGNKSFLTESSSYDLEILNYDKKTFNTFNSSEKEAFLVAYDIKKKQENHYQVMDNNTLRDLEYKDICLLSDSSTSFQTFKKIFEYLNIPLTIYIDENIIDNLHLNLYKNILLCLIKINTHLFDSDFNHAFTSVIRSYLFETKDNEIYEIITNKKYYIHPFYKLCEEINKTMTSLSNLFELICLKLNIYEKIITVGNVRDAEKILEFLYNISSEFSQKGYDINKLYEYLHLLKVTDLNIKVKETISSHNGVKMMTIHKSKGLEFPICYLVMSNKKFNFQDFNQTIIFNRQYGLILPFYSSALIDSPIKYLYKTAENDDLISEKIRLLYVAMTRAKEKNIIVASMDDSKQVSSYKSFANMLNDNYSLLKRYIVDYNLEDVGLTKDYQVSFLKDVNELIPTSDIKYEVKELLQDNKVINQKQISHVNLNILSKEEKKNIELGNFLHKTLECFDFVQKDSSKYNGVTKEVIDNLLRQDFMNEVIDYLKEVEFYFDRQNNVYHGIIDLLLVKKDCLVVVDYKLSDINHDYYLTQVKTYMTYLEERYKTKVKGYLYSLLTSEIKEVI